MLLGAHSFLAYALTDGDAVACDPTTASATGLLSPPALGASPRWAEDVLRLFPEIDSTLLPNLLTGETPDPVGTVSARAATSRSRSEFRPSGRSARRAHSAFPPAVTIDAATIAKSGFGCDSRNVPSLAAFASVVSHGAHVAIHPLVPR